jgi:hypothetical protein
MEALDRDSRLPHTVVHLHHRHTRMQPPSEFNFFYQSISQCPSLDFPNGPPQKEKTLLSRGEQLSITPWLNSVAKRTNSFVSVVLSDANRLFDNPLGSHSPTKRGGSDGNPIMPSSVAGETISMRRFRNLPCSSQKSGSRVPLLPRGMRPERDRVSPGCYLALSVALHSALPADRMRPRLMTTRRSKRIRGLF